MRLTVILLCVAWLCAASYGAVVEFENKANWQNAVSNVYTTISFTEFPPGQVTTQYSYLGVTFTDPDGDFIIPNSHFLNDGWGLYGNLDGTIDLSLSYPINSISAEYPGSLQIQLFSGTQLMYTSTIFAHAGSGHFAGLVSDQPFDMIRILDPIDHTVYIDDLYFGPPIPAPGAVALLAIAGISPRRRRRRLRLGQGAVAN